MSKLITKISNGIKKFNDFFIIKCPKCGTKMEEEYYIHGMIDSMYHLCPNCGHKLDQGDE